MNDRVNVEWIVPVGTTKTKGSLDVYHPGLEKLESKNRILTEHPLYQILQERRALQIFMETHIFAVWDFMSLLKSLQLKITGMGVPWMESAYPSQLVRFINEIVLTEESDENEHGSYSSHFSLYLRAMKEGGASPMRITSFLERKDYSHLYPEEADFVGYTLDLSMNGSPEEVASSFFFGREKLIPSMFNRILAGLGEDKQSEFPALLHYLRRHVEVDGEQHGPLAWSCLKALCGQDREKWDMAIAAAERSLDLRAKLWDGVHKRIIELKEVV